MKYMTFNNSCFFAAIANLLESFEIDIQDEDIIRGSLIPYLFKYDTETSAISSGYYIQDFNVINDYLKQYIVKLSEIKFENGSIEMRKKELIKNLTQTDKQKIVSLKTIDNQAVWHATIFVGMYEDKYKFINMRKSDDETTEFLLGLDELLEKLSDNVQFAWIERINSFNIINKRELLEDSLKVLNLLQEKIENFSCNKHTHQERITSRDILFRPLLLNYTDIARILNQEELLNNLQILQKEYIKTFNIIDKLRIFDYLDMELLRNSIKIIKGMILSQIKTPYYHGSKTPGITKLYPNMSIYGEEYVYLTTKKEVALIYTVNAIESFFEANNLPKPAKFHPWYSYGFSKCKIQIDEYYLDALEETYKGKSGYLYLCSEPKQDISNKTNIFCAITTKEEIKVYEEIFINDIHAEFLDLESKGIIEIRRYRDWNSKELQQIHKNILGTIEHFDLYSKPSNHYTLFLKDKFPNLFENSI